MISEKLFKALNEQVNFEFYSAHIYLAMASYCSSIDYDGAANFFVVQAEEERFHGMKMYNYVNETDGKVKMEAIAEPASEFDGLVGVFKKALAHENLVTSRIYNLMDIATEEKEHATISMLKWFLDEQVEEEATLKKLIKKLERIGDDGHGIFMVDEELAARVFTPPVA